MEFDIFFNFLIYLYNKVEMIATSCWEVFFHCSTSQLYYQNRMKSDIDNKFFNER